MKPRVCYHGMFQLDAACVEADTLSAVFVLMATRHQSVGIDTGLAVLVFKLTLLGVLVSSLTPCRPCLCRV